MFLEIVKRFRESQTDSPVRFVIIGDGSLRDKSSKMQSRSLGLSDALSLLRASEKTLEHFYPALDIVALTSRNEGTPFDTDRSNGE